MKSETNLSSNKKLVYRLIAEQGPVSKAELQATSSITSSTLTRLLNDMVAEGLIQVAELGTSSGGRRPIIYQINPDYKYIFGLEISRYSSTLGLFDMALNPKSTVSWRMDETFTPEHFVQHTIQQMKLFLRDHAIDRKEILGLGIAAVGPLDLQSGIILEPLYFSAPGWRDVAICQLFEQETSWQSHLENGVNASLMGEIWAMRDKGIQHALYIHAGVSLRSSSMSHGRIIHGSVDTEGSIGQMIVQAGGLRLNASGNYGALEAYASIQALVKAAQTQAKAGRSLGTPLHQVQPEDLNFDWLLKALEAGNPFATEIFEQSAVYFGIGLANLINTFHPEMVILGGALINTNSSYFDTSIEIAKRNTFYYPKYAPRFSKGLLREDAAITGAALNVWQSMLDGPN